MSLPESLWGDLNSAPSGIARPGSAGSNYRSTVDDTIEKLSAALDGLYVIQGVQRISREMRGQEATAIIFSGQLLEDAEVAYPIVAERFRTLGYTPLMERRNGQDVVVAAEGLIQERTFSSPVWLHILLLVITIFTTTLSGAMFQGYRLDAVIRELTRRGDIQPLIRATLAGLPFALTLLLILGVHEMGHYIAARRHGVKVTLPYFIPFPFIGILGTMGAVIFIKSPLNNRKQLFDVGVAGPLAGFVVALIAFIIGLNMRASPRPNQLFYDIFRSERIGMPILLQVVADVAKPDLGAPLWRHVSRQPIALAAWFGMLLTVLNLIPIGQLDGGHVMYTLFGRFAWTIALVVFVGMIVLGLTIFPSLIFFAFLVLLTGLRHPPPGNDITTLDWKRKAIGYATIALFFLIGTLQPFALGGVR